MPTRFCSQPQFCPNVQQGRCSVQMEFCQLNSHVRGENKSLNADSSAVGTPENFRQLQGEQSVTQLIKKCNLRVTS